MSASFHAMVMYLFSVLPSLINIPISSVHYTKLITHIPHL